MECETRAERERDRETEGQTERQRETLLGQDWRRMPKAGMTAFLCVPPRTPANDLYGFLVSWAGRNDEAIATPTTDVQRSAFRVHIF